MPKIYEGTVGVKLRVDTGIDLSDATKVSLIVKKPDGTEVEWIGNIANDRFIEYVTRDGDLDIAGAYKIQAYIEFGDGSKYLGETTGIYVYKKFD